MPESNKKTIAIISALFTLIPIIPAIIGAVWMAAKIENQIYSNNAEIKEIKKEFEYYRDFQLKQEDKKIDLIIQYQKMLLSSGKGKCYLDMKEFP